MRRFFALLLIVVALFPKATIASTPQDSQAGLRVVHLKPGDGVIRAMQRGHCKVSQQSLARVIAYNDIPVGRLNHLPIGLPIKLSSSVCEARSTDAIASQPAKSVGPEKDSQEVLSLKADKALLAAKNDSLSAENARLEEQLKTNTAAAIVPLSQKLFYGGVGAAILVVLFLLYSVIFRANSSLIRIMTIRRWYLGKEYSLRAEKTTQTRTQCPIEGCPEKQLDPKNFVRHCQKAHPELRISHRPAEPRLRAALNFVRALPAVFLQKCASIAML